MAWRDDPARRAEYQRLYYQRNRERMLEQRKAYGPAHRAAINARVRERYAGKYRDVKAAGRIGTTVEAVRTARATTNCEICGRVATCIDHIHGTSVVRGHLCNNCNSGIGFMQDSPKILIAAAAYVETRT